MRSYIINLVLICSFALLFGCDEKESAPEPTSEANALGSQDYCKTCNYVYGHAPNDTAMAEFCDPDTAEVVQDVDAFSQDPDLRYIKCE